MSNKILTPKKQLYLFTVQICLFISYNMILNTILNVQAKQNFIYRNQSSSTTLKAVQSNTDKSVSQSKDSVIDEGKKLLVGSVEQVISWCRMLSFLDSTKIIYQVYGKCITKAIFLNLT